MKHLGQYQVYFTRIYPSEIISETKWPADSYLLYPTIRIVHII